ncbi:MAG: efflux RND transporter periplasmic adaptor subunit [Planctomycetia bacterium]|nr:efflux RND transporter periplasmic adaptor subunit [Planctomycetia bacterium]
MGTRTVGVGRVRPAGAPAGAPRRRVPRWAAALGAACAAVGVATTLAACGGGGEAKAKARPTRTAPVVVAKVEPRDLEYVVEGTGSLEAYQVVTVPARVDGIVEVLGFDEGSLVETTTELAVVDRSRRRLALTEAETSVAEAKAAVATAEAAVPRAVAAVERAAAGVERAAALESAAATDLREGQEMLARRDELRRASPGAVSVEEVAQMRAQVDRRRDAVGVAQAARREAEGAKAEAEGAVAVAKAAVVEAEAEVASAESRRAIAARTAEDAVVRSPIRGVVRRRLATVGQYLRAGDAIAEIVDRTRLRVRFRVTEPESARVEAGMPAAVVVPSLGPAAHPAAIVHVDETASAVTRMVDCLAELDAPAPALRPGYYAVVAVRTKRARAIAVPDAALQPGEKGWVAFVVEDGKARARVLVLGLRTRDGLVEVVQGLAVGETIVVRGGNVLADGVAVSVVDPSAAKGPGGAGAPGAATGAGTGGPSMDAETGPR